MRHLSWATETSPIYLFIYSSSQIMFVISVYLFQSDKTVAWQRTNIWFYNHFDDLLQDKEKGISHHAPGI